MPGLLGLLDLISAPSPEQARGLLSDLVAAPRNRLRGLLDNPIGFANDALQEGLFGPPEVRAARDKFWNKEPMTDLEKQAYTNQLLNMGMAGLTVYHGSPHKFDKFDMSKIGTGEGKQQQGVGLYFAESKDVGQKYADRLADMHGKNEGNLYKVDLPDDAVSKFANYETSFMQQPETVRNAVAPLITDDVMHNLTGYYGWEKVDDAPMAAIMGALDISNGNSREVVTDLFRQNSIPGIRYLDGGSRNAGQGTYNYVVFDDTLPTILERNGQKLK